MYKIPIKHFPVHIRSCNLSPPYIHSTTPNITDICAQRVCLTFVGSRRPSEYGKRCTHNLIKALSQTPCCIISGLAYGIDTYALEYGLAYNIPCIAVPGSGIEPNVIYPRAHTNLAKKIVHNGGALITQFDPYAHSKPWMFPVRNKVMASLCHATIVIEATESSGSLITAFHALELNKDIFAVPGPIDSPTSYGTHKLLNYGAQPILSPQTLYDYVRNHSHVQHIYTSSQTSINKQVQLHNPQHATIDKNSSLETCIQTFIHNNPCTLDTLISYIRTQSCNSLNSQIKYQEILNLLYELEIKGLITKQHGLYSSCAIHI